MSGDFKLVVKFIDVVVGILMQFNGDVLLGQCLDGKFYVGYWEFFGGKVELGESIFVVLQCEFKEELGIEVLDGEFWCGVEYVYLYVYVCLYFYISC